jgi:hypothetical protein
MVNMTLLDSMSYGLVMAHVILLSSGKTIISLWCPIRKLLCSPKRTKTTLSLSPTGKNAVQRKDRVLRLEKKLLLHSFFRIYWRGKLMQISIEND